MLKVLVIGTGGLARELTSYFAEDYQLVEIVGFSSTNLDEHGQFNLPGAFFAGEVTPDTVGTSQAVIAIGNPRVKRAISEKLRAAGFSFPTLVHPSSVVSSSALLSEGVVVSPNCTVSPRVQLGNFCYLNFCCGVGHDAVVGAYSQVNPGCQLGGFVTIGEGSLVGSGSTILQGISVGREATIASGSVVFTRVADGATMMGNPAKRMRALETQ